MTTEPTPCMIDVTLHVPAALWQRFRQGCRQRQRSSQEVLQSLLARTIDLWQRQDTLVEELQRQNRPLSVKERALLDPPF